MVIGGQSASADDVRGQVARPQVLGSEADCRQTGSVIEPTTEHVVGVAVTGPARRRRLVGSGLDGDISVLGPERHRNDRRPSSSEDASQLVGRREVVGNVLQDVPGHRQIDHAGAQRKSGGIPRDITVQGPQVDPNSAPGAGTPEAGHVGRATPAV